MAETSQNARALRPTKRTDAKGRSAAPDADASVRGQEEAETHTSARGAARVAARKAAHQKQAQAEREQKAAEKAAKKAQKKAAKAAEKDSRGGFAFFKKGAAEKNDQVETGETTSLSVVNGANAGAGAASGPGAAAAPDPAARPTHRSEADARALRFATAGGRGDLSSSHTDPAASDDAQAASGSSRHSAASEKTFDFTGAANSVKDFCRRHLVVVAVLAAIVVVAISVYEPAKTYYLAWRTGTALQTSYDSLTKSNDDLQDDVERLQTKEGIEDEARKKGYVSPGETAVKVEGLPDDSAGGQAQEEDPWYIQLGDTIFGYTAS